MDDLQKKCRKSFSDVQFDVQQVIVGAHKFILARGHMDQGRGILSRIWSTVKFKQIEANIVLNVLSVQYWPGDGLVVVNEVFEV